MLRAPLRINQQRLPIRIHLHVYLKPLQQRAVHDQHLRVHEVLAPAGASSVPGAMVPLYAGVFRERLFVGWDGQR